MKMGDAEWWQMASETVWTLYRDLLHREPDWSGWGTFTGLQREQGWTAEQVANAIKASDEYKALHMPPVLKRPTPRTHQWFIDGKEWKWRGATDFRLLQRYLAGEDLAPLLKQRTDAGCNVVRVLAMKRNNTGWELRPDYDLARLGAFFNVLEHAGLYCQLTVFADTRVMMPDAQKQKDFWYHVGDVAVHHTNVFLDLVNEWNHPTQAINPQQFSLITGVLCSHGSGGTDQHAVDPFWHFTTYHARRDVPPNARGFTNYDPFEFEASWPKPCPQIAEESIKPPQYGYDPRYAYLLGRHAGIGCGGTFHWSGGVNSERWTDQEFACAKAFYQGVGA